MRNQTIDRWAWGLIFGGLIGGGLGLFVQRRDPGLGWMIVLGGGVAVALGVLLIVVRALREG